MKTPFLPLALCALTAWGANVSAQTVSLAIGGRGNLQSVSREIGGDEVARVKTYLDLFFAGGFQPAAPTNASLLVIETRNPDNAFVVGPAVAPQTSDRDLVIAGPAKFTLRYPVTRPTNYSALVTLDIQRTASPETTVPTAAVVIPSDAAGNVEICLESSTDLINWTAAQPGTYGAPTEKRFFRVRAVRK